MPWYAEKFSLDFQIDTLNLMNKLLIQNNFVNFLYRLCVLIFTYLTRIYVYPRKCDVTWFLLPYFCVTFTLLLRYFYLTIFYSFTLLFNFILYLYCYLTIFIYLSFKKLH